MKKKLSYFIFFFFSCFFVLFFSSYIPQIIAAECDNISDLNQKIDCLKTQVTGLHNTANTLSSQINYMDNQINLAALNIIETQNKIQSTQNEIELLTSRVNSLDNSLTYLSQLLLDKVVASYKQGTVSLFSLLLNSVDASDLMERIKYLRSAQASNQKLLVQVQETKANFEEQKQLREQKKVELDQLNKQLIQQQADLQSQKSAKDNLLAVTQKNETVYQNLLEKAQQELASFSAFTQNGSGGLTTFGNGSNGWYFTQRDPQWGNMTLPGSSSNVITAGCAVTSVAMVCKSYGQSITPATIVNDSSRFIAGDLWNWAFSCGGKTTTYIDTSQSSIQSYVKKNIPVILKLSAPSVSGLHFIVAYGWDDGANDLKIHDPYYGPDLKFSSRYNWSQIISAIVIN